MIWPATPTPLPPGGPPVFDVPISLWDAAPHAIQWWDWIGDAGTIAQVVLLVALVIIEGYVITRAFRKLTDLDSEK